MPTWSRCIPRHWKPSNGRKRECGSSTEAIGSGTSANSAKAKVMNSHKPALGVISETYIAGLTIPSRRKSECSRTSRANSAFRVHGVDNDQRAEFFGVQGERDMRSLLKWESDAQGTLVHLLRTVQRFVVSWAGSPSTQLCELSSPAHGIGTRTIHEVMYWKPKSHQCL